MVQDTVSSFAPTETREERRVSHVTLTTCSCEIEPFACHTTNGRFMPFRQLLQEETNRRRVPVRLCEYRSLQDMFTCRKGHKLADVDICRLPPGSTRCGFLHIVRPPDLLNKFRTEARCPTAKQGNNGRVVVGKRQSEKISGAA